MSRASSMLVALALVLALPAKAFAGESAGDLWESEGRTLRELVATVAGAEQAEVLLRLGEWERKSAQRLRGAIEEKTITAKDGQEQIDRHLDAARDAYVRALPLASPDRLPEVLFSLGDLLRFRNDPTDAEGPLTRLVNEHPEHPLAVDGAIALGDDAFDAGRLADAVHRFEFAVQKARSKESRGYAEYKLAWCHLNLNEYGQAQKLLLDVIDTANGADRTASLAEEARRDFVIALARDPSVTATAAAKQIRDLALDADRTRRYVESYARIIAGAGRDGEAVTLLHDIESGAPPPDAIRIFTSEVEIAVRQRNLGAESRSAARLADVVGAFPRDAGDDHDSAEHALRAAAAALHGEGRARGDVEMLRTAAHLYDDYFLAFDSDPESYELHHHAGELLASLKRPAAAERHYTAAVERDLARLGRKEDPGKWLEASAEGAIAAAQDALPQSAAPARQTPPTENDVDRPPPAETKLTGPEAIFVAACDRYLEALPNGRQAVEVRYQRALVWYRHNSLDRAAREMREVVRAQPDGATARFAAELAMDALQQLGRYDDLADLSLDLQKAPALRARLGPELSNTHEAAVLAAAARAASRRHYGEAARRYLSFIRLYPHSTRTDRALYNGAAALVDDGRLAEGVSLRARLLRDFPHSSLAERARARQLAEVLMLGRFAEGARLAAEIADDAHHVDAARHLNEAVTMAEAAGDPRGADRLREKYLTKHRSGAEAMTAALELADHARGCEAALKAARTALSVAPDSGWRVIALTRLATREMKCRHEDEGHFHAAEAAAMGSRLHRDRADALDASAEGALLAARPLIDKLRKLPLTEPYERTLPRKLAALRAADEKLAQVVGRGRAGAAICALVSSGDAYADFAHALSQARPPHQYTLTQRELFRERLSEQAQPLFDRAKTAYLQSMTRGREANVDPSCLDGARRGLSALWPQRFGPWEEVVLKLTPKPTPPGITATAVLARAPDAPPAWLVAARAELTAGRPLAAVVLASRVPPTDPVSALALEVKAEALDAAGRHDAALAIWRELASNHPDRTLARRVLADRAIAGRDLESARDHLLALRRVDPSDPAVALDLGVVLRALGDAKGAEQSLTTAAALAPTRPEPILDLGLLLCGDGARPAEGLAALERVVNTGVRAPDLRGFDAAVAACRALAREKGR